MFDEKDLEFNSYEGKVYGIPVSKEISYIYYNKDLFAEAGLEAPDVAYETWDEFFDACDTLKSKILLRSAWTQQILDGFPTSGTADLSEQAVRKEMSL